MQICFLMEAVQKLIKFLLMIPEELYTILKLATKSTTAIFVLHILNRKNIAICFKRSVIKPNSILILSNPREFFSLTSRITTTASSVSLLILRLQRILPPGDFTSVNPSVYQIRCLWISIVLYTLICL